jgi:hypothetical protein
MNEIAVLINKYGFPIVAATGAGYLVFYVWQWATKDVKPIISEATGTLIKLIDRMRVLDNDLIRLQTKVETTIELRGKLIERERIAADEIINRPVEDISIGKHKAVSEEIKSIAGDN